MGESCFGMSDRVFRASFRSGRQYICRYVWTIRHRVARTRLCSVVVNLNRPSLARTAILFFASSVLFCSVSFFTPLWSCGLFIVDKFGLMLGVIRVTNTRNIFARLPNSPSMGCEVLVRDDADGKS